MEALTEVVRSGKARHVGFSEWNSEQNTRALDRVAGVEKFVSSQPQYSLLWREPERKAIPLCAANGIAQIVWSPLAQGVPTGKCLPGRRPPAGSRLGDKRMNGWMSRYSDEVLVRVQRLRGIVDRRGITTASSPSPGSCASRTSPRRSSAPHGPSRSARTSEPPGSRSTRRRWPRSTPRSRSDRANRATRSGCARRRSRAAGTRRSRRPRRSSPGPRGSSRGLSARS